MKISDTFNRSAYKRLTDEQANLRFELYEWLKEKGLSAREARALLSLTEDAISHAMWDEMNKIML